MVNTLPTSTGSDNERALLTEGNTSNNRATTVVNHAIISLYQPSILTWSDSHFPSISTCTHPWMVKNWKCPPYCVLIQLSMTRDPRLLYPYAIIDAAEACKRNEATRDAMMNECRFEEDGGWRIRNPSRNSVGLCHSPSVMGRQSFDFRAGLW